MPNAHPTMLSARLARLAAPTPDRDLLARFAATRDEAAFAELVRRHGPMVLAACRRVTRHAHDAEDAFQASFLILARKAGRLGPADRVGPWLYGVAVRAARKAAGRPYRRREVVGGAVPDVPAWAAEPPDADAARVVAEEVGRLPSWYRAAVVLCELEGRSRAAAARELGVAEGTLSSRLAKARKELARRLAARGLGPAALAALTGTAVPPRLASAASALATGTPAPPGVAALVNGVSRVMVLHERKAALAVGFLAVVALAAASAANPAVGPRPNPAGGAVAPPAPKAAPRALPQGPNKILIFKDRSLVLIDPDGKNEKRVCEHPGLLPEAKLSPDGKRIAFLVQVGKVGGPDDPPVQRHLFLRTIGGPAPGTDTGLNCQEFHWSPDGARLVASTHADRDGSLPEMTHVVVDAGTGARSALKLPPDHHVAGWLADGGRFATVRVSGTFESPKADLFLMNADGTEHRRLTRTGTVGGVPSPDGRRFLCGELPTDGQSDPGPARSDLFVFDPATGKRTTVEGLPLNGELLGACWSPDGRRIAYSWKLQPGKQAGAAPRETESHLTVADADGTNARTILTEKGVNADIIVLGDPDWR